MGHTIQQWEERLRAVMGEMDHEELEPGDAHAAIRQALRRHSRLFPRSTHADYPGNGSSFELSISPGMAAWVNGFSFIEAIEYPQGERDPVYLDEQSWELYPRTSVPTTIHLLTVIPATGETARVYYTAPWPDPDNTAATDLVADTDFDAVVHLAGYVVASAKASETAAHTRPSIPAAVLAGTEGESDRWEVRMKALLGVYMEHFGITPDSVVPADAILDWDVMSTWLETGHRFLFRGRR